MSGISNDTESVSLNFGNLTTAKSQLCNLNYTSDSNSTITAVKGARSAFLRVRDLEKRYEIALVKDINNIARTGAAFSNLDESLSSQLQ